MSPQKQWKIIGRKIVPNNSYEAKELPWDTEYFGVKAARVDLLAPATLSDQDRILGYCREFDFVTISNHNNTPENNLWIGTRTPAFLADMNIQFIKGLENNQINADSHCVIVNALPRTEEITQIAAGAYRHSRFFNDPKLPEEQARNVYKHWTECAFGQTSKYFVIDERNSAAVGYLLFSIDEDSCIIELIAVSPPYQGKKIGQSLLSALESYAMKNSLKRVKVGTQVSNTSAIRFYSKMGYTFSGCSSLYHLWNNSWEQNI